MITSYLPVKTKITKVGSTSNKIRKAIKNAGLTANHEVIDFKKALQLHQKFGFRQDFRKSYTQLIRYSLTVASQIRLLLNNHEDLGLRTLTEMLVAHGQNLKQ